MSKEFKIAEMIEKHMRKNNLTMKELGDIVGKSESTISLWISGKTKPRVGTVQDLADYFNITVNELMYGDDNPQSNNNSIDFNDVDTAIDTLLKLRVIQNELNINYCLLSNIERKEFTEDIKSMMKIIAGKYAK